MFFELTGRNGNKVVINSQEISAIREPLYANEFTEILLKGGRHILVTDYYSDVTKKLLAASK